MSPSRVGFDYGRVWIPSLMSTSPRELIVHDLGKITAVGEAKAKVETMHTACGLRLVWRYRYLDGHWNEYGVQLLAGFAAKLSDRWCKRCFPPEPT